MNWLVMGGSAAVAITVLMSCWQYLRAIYTQLAGLIVGSSSCWWLSGSIVLAYLDAHARRMPSARRTYTLCSLFVRPRQRREAVVVERLGRGTRLVWYGWCPILVARGVDGKAAESMYVINQPVQLTYIRGLLDVDQLLLDAVDYYNATFSRSDVNRYRVQYVAGSAGKPLAGQDLQGLNREGPTAVATASNQLPPTSIEEIYGDRILRWRLDELGAPRQSTSPIASLALSDEALELVADIRRWSRNREWFQARGLPWKCGCLFYGPPGTGKTALARALAEELDLPVYQYDLATLYNDELRTAWARMLGSTPCMALFEDIDAVFRGRETLRGDLTFDCLLNCLDGIEQADGVLTVITTNHPEALDAALCGDICGASVSRPGRIDRALAFTVLDAAGRYKLCQRILPDDPDTWDDLVEAGEQDTGAQFQQRCATLAKQRYWGAPQRQPLALPCS